MGNLIKTFSKLTIAYKEARGISLLDKIAKRQQYLTEKQASSLLKDNEELLKIIGTIQKTMKKGFPQQ